VKLARPVVAAIALAATGLLGACTSQPSVKAVAKDVVQSITVPGTGERLPQAQQQCMLDVIDKMTNDELNKLGADNLNATITSSGGGNAAMQAFIAKLQGCEPSGSSSTTPAASTTAASSTTTTLG
jgi:hypothetical protein